MNKTKGCLIANFATVPVHGPYKLNFRAPLPLILFSEPGRFNPLKNYVKGERQKRGDFNEKYRSVLPRIGLVEVIRESK
ncbi:hypothetical protein [Klebsiella pneumoniae]|uniref:hypothetical protein n=1 Tax=Klebsiella pneumoniae TaxID=573 RepID=UPI0021570092|nr:hypothetical protein [Klebsiella pneumoniae]